MHKNIKQLVDDPTSLPVWNITLTVTHAFFNFGESIFNKPLNQLLVFTKF